jgi:hypothetical protein
VLSWVFTWINPATFWGLGAALPAVLAEYLYRRLPEPWIEYWWLWTSDQRGTWFALGLLTMARVAQGFWRR